MILSPTSENCHHHRVTNIESKTTQLFFKEWTKFISTETMPEPLVGAPINTWPELVEFVGDKMGLVFLPVLFFDFHDPTAIFKWIFIQNPEKYRHSFNDGSNKLIGYNDGTCPARPNGRPSFCKQEAFDKACFIKLEAHFGPVTGHLWE